MPGPALVWMLLIAAAFAVLQLADVSGRDTPDTKNYLSYTLSLQGESKREAARLTIDYACAGDASLARRDQSVDVIRFHRPNPYHAVQERCRAEQWTVVERHLRAGESGGHTVPFMSARFQRIFEVRPGYPVFLVPFVWSLGAKWGLWTASVVIAGAGGVLVCLVLRTLRVRTPLALTGQVLFHVLPVGTTAMRPMTEGLMLALTLTAVWGCALALTRRVRTGALLTGGALAALFTVKHSQSLFLGVCLAAAGCVLAVRRRRHGRPAGTGVAVLAAVGAAGALLTALAARALNYPSETESLQDLLTAHFTRPDRAHPWPEFLHLEIDFWVEWTRRQLWEPLLLAALGAGTWGALRQRPAFGGFLVAAAFTGILNQAAHPDIGIWGDRLIVLVWVVPVVGLPLLMEALTEGRPRVAAVPVQGKSPREGSGVPQ
jgi:hypothetical protein